METSEAIGITVVAILLVGIVLPFIHHPSPPSEILNFPGLPSEVKWTTREELPEFESLRVTINDGVFVLKEGERALYVSKGEGSYAYSIPDEKTLDLTVSDMGVKVEVPFKLKELTVNIERGMLNLDIGAERVAIGLTNGMHSGRVGEASWLLINMLNGVGNLDVYTDEGQITVQCENSIFTLNVHIPEDVGLKVTGEATNAGFGLQVNGKGVGSSYVDPDYESYSKKVDIKYEVNNGWLSINVKRG